MRNVFNTKSLFYADWCGCGIIYLKDLFEERHFLSIKDLLGRLETKKQAIIFDYTKLKKAIPKIWFSDLTKEETEPVYYIHPLGIPYFKFGSKRFYNLISLNIHSTTTGAVFLGKIKQQTFLQPDIF